MASYSCIFAKKSHGWYWHDIVHGVTRVRHDRITRGCDNLGCIKSFTCGKGHKYIELQKIKFIFQHILFYKSFKDNKQ